MPLLNYTTKVNVYTTMGEIQAHLVKHGARNIMQDYDDDGRIAAEIPSGSEALLFVTIP